MPGHEITTEPLGRVVRIEVDGAVVAESANVVALSETGLPTRYYFPPEDVRTDLLASSDAHTHCPFKGDASYYDLGERALLERAHACCSPSTNTSTRSL